MTDRTKCLFSSRLLCLINTAAAAISVGTLHILKKFQWKTWMVGTSGYFSSLVFFAIEFYFDVAVAFFFVFNRTFIFICLMRMSNFSTQFCTNIWKLFSILLLCCIAHTDIRLWNLVRVKLPIVQKKNSDIIQCKSAIKFFME